MDYDYRLFENIIITFMEDSFRDPDDLEIGYDISSMPEVKIIFDGYGDLEEEVDGEYVYTERGNKNMESYAIFIHKDALNEDFVFPEHEMTPWALIHRSKEEVCVYVWYDAEMDAWDILPLEDRIDSDNTMNEEDVMRILQGLHKKYFESDE